MSYTLPCFLTFRKKEQKVSCIFTNEYKKTQITQKPFKFLCAASIDHNILQNTNSNIFSYSFLK